MSDDVDAELHPVEVDEARGHEVGELWAALEGGAGVPDDVDPSVIRRVLAVREALKAHR